MPKPRSNTPVSARSRAGHGDLARREAGIASLLGTSLTQSLFTGRCIGVRRESITVGSLNQTGDSPPVSRLYCTDEGAEPIHVGVINIDVAAWSNEL